MRLRTLLTLAALACTASGAVALSQSAASFPHDRHEGLFPLCQGCHGMETADRLDDYPDPEGCAACHDGVEQERVTWTGPVPTPSNLRFSHPTHARRTREAGDSATCASCHRPAGEEGWMAVARPRAGACLACHAHQAPEHLSPEQPCRQCHLPLAEAEALDGDRIAAFPRPDSHEADGFVATHAPAAAELAACATCHTRDSCLRCHLDGDRVEAIAALAPDARVAALVAGRPPSYPRPASHGGGGWSWGHGEAATAPRAGCANCHARPSCTLCHRQGVTPAIDGLPLPAPGRAAGVTPDSTLLRSVHPAGFATTHGGDAAAGGRCGSCHTEASCIDCHQGPVAPSFHPYGFVELHGPRAYGAETDCGSCHNPELFCRSCHEGVGLAASGRTAAGLHDAQPFWLLGHGAAARRGLEGCASCHAQGDCARCHAAVGGWRVSPHGPGFAADRLRDAGAAGCILCHRAGVPPT